METKDFNIILDSKTDSNLMIMDYDNEYPKSILSKQLKIGVLGTVLLCSSPHIYATEIKYSINDNIHTESFDCVKDFSSQFDKYVDDVSSIDKINFTKKEVLRGILSFKSLNNSWDGYGALPLEIDGASNAISVLNSIDEKLIGKIEDYYPNSHGTISFEWLNGLKEKLFLEIGNEYFSFFVKYNGVEPLFFNELEFNNENIQMLSKYIKSI